MDPRARARRNDLTRRQLPRRTEPPGSDAIALASLLDATSAARATARSPAPGIRASPTSPRGPSG